MSGAYILVQNGLQNTLHRVSGLSSCPSARQARAVVDQISATFGMYIYGLDRGDGLQSNVAPRLFRSAVRYPVGRRGLMVWVVNAGVSL